MKVVMMVMIVYSMHALNVLPRACGMLFDDRPTRASSNVKPGLQ